MNDHDYHEPLVNDGLVPAPPLPQEAPAQFEAQIPEAEVMPNVAVENRVTIDQPGHFEVDFQTLKDIPIPDKTSSYTPVPYVEAIEDLYTHADNILGPKGFKPNSQQFVINKHGQRLFFVLSYRNSDTNLHLAIAGRNSYDKSMVNARAVGARVVCCVNLLIYGDVSFTRRHTGNANEDMSNETIITLYKSANQWNDIRRFRDEICEIDMTPDQGYALMGIAKSATSQAKTPAGRLLTTNKEWDDVVKEIRMPTNVDDGTRGTLWHWYNSFTVNMKSLKPEDQLGKHHALHQFVEAYKDRIPS